MINLLPPQQKEEIREEEKLKMILIFGILLLSLSISFCLILSLVKISISTQIETKKISFNQEEKEFQGTKDQELEEKIKSLNATLLKLDAFYGRQFDLTQTLEEISGLLPSDAYLTNLSFNPIRDGGKLRARIFLSGFAKSREILLSFRENLENDKNFSEIDFPPENWVKPADINFSVNFKVK